ncbi:ATP-dependent helicase, partial [Seleniivibrio woodruffii]|uniref:ATP-dependent helicase n=1 Tax=Seleniivibrio woodruffii TaxID=1078050 RepID=UPI0039E666F0
MPDYSKELNQQQYEAVTKTEGPLLVLAGAGTGKTRVITYRIAHLINNLGVSAHNILAVTFTNKAAGEMKERIMKLVSRSQADIWIGTFHSICLRLLRRDGHLLGLGAGFGILDQDDRLSVVRDIVKNLNIDVKKYPPKQYMWRISNYKNTRAYVDGLNPGTDPFHMMDDVFKIYQQKLKEQNFIDFDDMLALTIRLFRTNPEVLEYYKNMFRYILVDEYQDTNDIQFLFLNMLSGDDANICVVGDDDQSIYGWRGADIRNILEFDSVYPSAKIVRLTENYRSRPVILTAANQLIKNNSMRKGKDLQAFREEGGMVQVMPVSNETAEAEYVVGTIKNYLDEGVPADEIAVLYRTNAQSRNFEVFLNRLNVSYKVIGGISFYQRREIKDILSYLRLYDNPYDTVSFARSVKAPPRGVGDTAVDSITEYASHEGINLLEASKRFLIQMRGAQRKGMEPYLAVFEELTTTPKISQMVKLVIDSIDYEGFIKRYEDEHEAEKRIDNIKELYNAAVQFEMNVKDGTISDFLAATSLTTSVDEGDGTAAVKLMTIHSAKGLEFENVFLTGLENGLFPLQGSLDEPDQLEEERRLCYVGVTRAKQNLHMSYAGTRMVYGKVNPQRRSGFIDEMGIVGMKTAPQ